VVRFRPWFVSRRSKGGVAKQLVIGWENFVVSSGLCIWCPGHQHPTSRTSGRLKAILLELGVGILSFRCPKGIRASYPSSIFSIFATPNVFVQVPLLNFLDFGDSHLQANMTALLNLQAFFPSDLPRVALTPLKSIGIKIVVLQYKLYVLRTFFGVARQIIYRSTITDPPAV
jgi:hypothetical protein